MSSPSVVAGVDVGGLKKGFDAVALRNGAYWRSFRSTDAQAVASWCREVGATLVGVDAPCQWSLTGRARPAEREMMAKAVWCFSTPSLEAAKAHSGNHFGWMLNGAELYRHLLATHPLFSGEILPPRGPVCFETFPQAIACALAGQPVSAKKKRAVRREILARAKLDIQELSNIDKVDAALCALTAQYLARGDVKCFGELSTGLIVVPGTALSSDAVAPSQAG